MLDKHYKLLSALVLLASLCCLQSNEARAAGGQCKWEGGSGVSGGFAYCEAEDCAGNGGTAMCSAGVGAPHGDPNAPTGPDNWRFMACDESGPSIPRSAMWCAAAGGTWAGPETGCTGLPGGFIGNSGLEADNVGTLEQAASAYYNCPSSSDTGWGGAVYSYNCWSGGPLSKLGIFILDHRQKTFAGPGCGGTVTFLKIRDAKCPPGYRSRNAVGGPECFIPGDCCVIGHPVSPLTGAKALSELDYQGRGPGGLTLKRQYRSTGYFRPTEISTAIDTTDTMLPRDYWRISHDRRFFAVNGNAEVSAIVQRADGTVQIFDVSGDEVGSAGSGKSRLEFISGIGWNLILPESDIEHYNLAGQLVSIQTRAGLTTTLSYNSASGLLESVTDHFGHVLALTRDTNGLITIVTQPDGGQIQYSYDRWNRLTTVAYPDNTTRVYTYGDTRNDWLITEVQDESGQQYVSYTYDAEGRVISESLAGGAAPYAFSYNVSGTGSTVTDPSGVVSQWTYSAAGGRLRLSSHSAPCRDCGNESGVSYDANGNPSARTDFNGYQTLYIHDPARNLETWRTEAAGTPEARVTTTQWHSVFRLPVQIDRPGQRTTFTYDSHGNQLTRTITDLATSGTRTWTFTYNSLGQILTADGPRTDVNDVVTYTYYSCTNGYGCGQPATVTDAAGHVTQYLTYDGHGNPLTMSDPNGLITTIAYDARQRVLSRAMGSEVAAFEYWPTGLLKKATLPDGSFIAYTYDGAHRLIGLADGEGNRAVYTLDAAGNRTREDTFDPSNTLFTTRTRVFDGLGRLEQEIGAANQSVGYEYDGVGQLISTTDPLGRLTLFAYDPLGRMSDTVDPMGGAIAYSYDARDNLEAVVDPRGLQTSYAYNGFDDQAGLSSPDTGMATRNHDSAGNIVESTDSRNRTGEFTYDALGRLTEVEYSDQTIQYTYDTGANALGRLSSFSDGSGSTAYTYDSHGRVASKVQTVGSVSSTVAYAYNASGQLVSATTPSGQAIQYTYANNRISSISLNGTVLINNVLYAPFGPTRGWQWGNGAFTIREYDADGRLTTIDSAGLTTYTYNADGTIQSRIDDAPSPDNAGNSSLSIQVSAGSNRIAAVSPQSGPARVYSYDAAGNTISDGLRTFAYNDAGRMISSTLDSVSTFYAYNALGQRVKKAGAGGTRHFSYDEGGHLLGVYDASGARIEELVWFGDIPIATIRTSPTGGVGVFYIHTDNLNTPVKLARTEDNAVMWRWDRDPYGGGFPDNDVDENGAFVFFDLRFPGQQFDSETGLHYNYYRDYDPAVGRYVESDPIGLEGGLNTYLYVEANPLMLVDPAGLTSAVGSRAPGIRIPGIRIPAPNPIATAGIIGFGFGTAMYPTIAEPLGDLIDRMCKPDCTPPKGTVCFIIDRVPPSKPHWPITGSHYHLWQMNQDPSGVCHWNKLEPKASRTAPPGAIPCPFTRPKR